MIPAMKNVVTALAKAHMSRLSADVIDDLAEGKSPGLITLLQYEIQHLVLFYRLAHTPGGLPK